MATYNSGSTVRIGDHNFISSMDLHRPDNNSELINPFNKTLTGFMKMAGAMKATTQAEFSHYFEERLMPKVKVTCAGAAADTQATFTIHADSKVTSAQYSPYDTSIATTVVSIPIRKWDLIKIRPAAGTMASTGAYINCVVLSVSGTTSFVARPTDSTKAIPAIASAQEVIIYGNMYPEGSGFQAGLQTRVGKRTEYAQIIKHKMSVTGSEKVKARWVDAEKTKATLPGETNAYNQFLTLRDRVYLVGEALSSTGLATLFADGTQSATGAVATNGLFTQASTGGQVLNYSNITGVTLANIRDFNVLLAKNGGQMKNQLSVGINLDQQLDVELGDRMANGAITYGNFTFDQEKAIALNFAKFQVGSYVYDKRCLEALHDVQTLGADGFGYSYEGVVTPLENTKALGGEDKGQSVASIRMRYLAKGSDSRESIVNYWEGMKYSAEGTDQDEVRYMTESGVEAICDNQLGLWKRA